MNVLDIQSILLFVPGVIIGLTVHEFSHAFAAYKLGDETAKQSGRLTLNPLKHIDPIGFLFMVIAGFGWAKPVQFNPTNLRHKNRDEIIISLAGPLSNLVMGIVLFIFARLLFFMDYFSTTQNGVDIINFILTCGELNFGLFIFNLIPIPPLDGSHLYMTFLHKTNPVLMNNLYRYGVTILLIIFVIQSRIGIDILPIWKVINAISNNLLNWLRFAG